jgi:hypothetical protein
MIKRTVQQTVLAVFLLVFVLTCKSAVYINVKKQTMTEDKLGESSTVRRTGREYDLHKNIKTTYFYIGEKNRKKSRVHSNGSSAWMSHWDNAYGGYDPPEGLEGFFPKNFTARENPFYVALPYNDITPRGHKGNIYDVIPWAEEMKNSKNGEFVSYCKNRWVKITYKDRVCYAQWEDVGPFETDDWMYVFGTARPKNKRNGGVGLDISPASFKYLGMTDNDYTDWKFVDFIDVPDGPWLRVISISNPTWN